MYCYIVIFVVHDTDFIVAFSGIVVIKILLRYSDMKEKGSFFSV